MEGEFEHLTVEKDENGRMARITLDRTERLNAIDQPAVRDLDAASQLLADEQEVRLITIQGNGRAFCTGIDLKALSRGEIGMDYFLIWERALRRFETMDSLVLCFVHGYALGGGLQLAMACDIRVCTPSAELGLPAIKEGLIPGLGTWRLPRYIGMGRAKKMTLFGNNVDGEEAVRIGLVDHLVEEDRMTEEFDELVGEYMAVNSKGCRLSKEAIQAAFDLNYERFLDRYMDLQSQAIDSEDFEEAMAAYREERMPEWS